MDALRTATNKQTDTTEVDAALAAFQRDLDSKTQAPA